MSAKKHDDDSDDDFFADSDENEESDDSQDDYRSETDDESEIDLYVDQILDRQNEVAMKNNKEPKENAFDDDDLSFSDDSDFDQAEEVEENPQDVDMQDFAGELITRSRVRTLLTFSKLKLSTRKAIEAEKERRSRLQEKELVFDTEIAPTIANLSERVILDYEPKTKKVLVEVDSAFVPLMKEHQKSGVKVKHFKAGFSRRGGCIHSIDNGWEIWFYKRDSLKMTRPPYFMM